MSLLGWPRARDLSRQMAPIDEGRGELLAEMTGQMVRPDETLAHLLVLAAEAGTLMAQSAFRFGATRAYEALVQQRVAVLREERFEGRQTFNEFMMRRVGPALRTVRATGRRVQQMTDRTFRAGDLPRTRVDVRPIGPEP